MLALIKNQTLQLFAHPQMGTHLKRKKNDLSSKQFVFIGVPTPIYFWLTIERIPSIVNRKLSIRRKLRKYLKNYLVTKYSLPWREGLTCPQRSRLRGGRGEGDKMEFIPLTWPFWITRIHKMHY
jgi:hypothetical protein